VPSEGRFKRPESLNKWYLTPFPSLNSERPQIEQPSFDKKLAAANLIRRDLIEKSDEDPTVWGDKYAVDLRQIIEEDPELLQRYEKNPGIVENFILQQLQNRKIMIH